VKIQIEYLALGSHPPPFLLTYKLGGKNLDIVYRIFGRKGEVGGKPDGSCVGREEDER
jgi:hypothetical protein